MINFIAGQVAVDAMRDQFDYRDEPRPLTRPSRPLRRIAVARIGRALIAWLGLGGRRSVRSTQRA